MKALYYSAIFTFSFFLLCSSANAQNGETIKWNIENSGRTERFYDLAAVSGILCALEENGPYTVFAPTDQGFELVPDSIRMMYRSPEGRGTLRKILAYHIVPGRYTTATMRTVIDGSPTKTLELATLQGEKISIAYGDGLFRVSDVHGNTHVIPDNFKDIEASNGLVNYTVGVLMPSPGSKSMPKIRDCDQK